MKTAPISVDLIDHMGSDLSIVNAARVSFDKVSYWATSDTPTNLFTFDQGDTSPTYLKLSERDAKLIQYLARGITTQEKVDILSRIITARNLGDAKSLFTEIRRITPHELCFAHAVAQFRVTAPIAIARQLWKSHIGLASQDDSLGWNEVSRRYVDEEPSFYMPDKWRKKAENVKQGSSNEEVEPPIDTEEVIRTSLSLYQEMLDDGIAPEQARLVLTQNANTTWIWTGSLLAFSRICKLRQDSHAQGEAQVAAQQIAAHMSKLFPVSWQALAEN
jgi:thymidylate synthase (FAD)